jgi:hypothetical protein
MNSCKKYSLLLKIPFSNRKICSLIESNGNNITFYLKL